MSLFKLRGDLSKPQSLLLGLAGFFLFILLWWILAELLAVNRPIVDYDIHLPSSLDSTSSQINRDSLARADSIAFADATEFEKVYPILPTPLGVVKSYPSLIRADDLSGNTLHSVWLNLQGYFWAILLCIPIGFLIGLFPLFRGLFSKQVDALRYLPLTALTGLFIIWFGIEDRMKVAFLAFGILVYLLPVVVQRINEVEDVYLKTVFTLGANTWQTIRKVYMPSVFSKLIDDIRVLTAISWTYIIIAELVNRQGGIGALIFLKSRQGDMEKVFAILIVIVLIGFIQDRLFIYLDRRLFPHKYYKTSLMGIKEVEYGIFTMFGVLVAAVFLPIVWSGYPLALNSLAFIVLIAAVIIVIYGEFRLRKSLVN
ncbi:MAG: hypothetical protein DHS20C18_12620 [Saprospiraceae bacterium]|nr:MAG: hypothetical protein DHS20C18_12620 [Saprospiraceae bacterium]